jgi:hypothetical protein
MPTGGIQEPSAVKIFGILHLILAGIGFLMGIWSFFASQLNSFFMNSNSAAFKGRSDHMAAQTRYVEEMNWVSIMSGGFMLALAGLLLTSGLMLVRSQPRGVTWSQRYAWTSIATKLISLVVTVAVVLPAMQRMMDEAMAFPTGMPAGAADKMTGIIKSFTAITTVATPLISCIYPALALYFLSRPQIKEWAGLRRSGGA